MNTESTKYIWSIVLVLIITGVAFPRFDRQDIGPIKKYTGKIDGEQSLGDAIHYIRFVDFFRGNCEIGDVELPFRYRPLVPFVASLLPVSSPMTAINIINLLALYVTIFFLYKLLRQLEFSFGLSILGVLMYAISFPVFYMSTTGYLEACAMCLLTIGTFLIFKEKWFLVALTIVAGAFVKEVIALLIPVAVAYIWASGTSKKKLVCRTLVLILAFAIPTAVIKLIFKETGDFYWIPNIPTLLFNLRIRALASLLLSFGIPGLLSIIMFTRYRRLSPGIEKYQMIPLFAGLFSTLLLVIYSMMTAYTDGRFIWPAAIYTIPFSLWLIRGWLSRKSMGIVHEVSDGR